MDISTLIDSYDPTIDWVTHPEQRRTFIGASDAAAIMGLDPYRSPIDVWLTKLGRHPDPFDGNELTEFGHRVEPFIAKWVDDDHDDWQIIDPESRTWRHPEFDCLAATPDRIIAGATLMSADMEPGLLECKSADWRFADQWENDAPDRYVIQAHAQMACTGARWVQLACLLDRRLAEYRVDWDQQLGEMVVDRMVEFWGHVQDGTEPPLVGHPNEAADLQHVWTPTGTAAEVDARLVEQYREAKAREEEAKRDASTLKAAIVAQMAEATEGQVDGETVVTWNARTELDLDAVREANPEAVEECTVPVFDGALFRKTHPDLARAHRRTVGRTLRLKKEAA